MIKVAAIIGAALLLMWMAFTSGRYYQIPVEQEKAKAAQVGFYDMKTGGFVYGVPPKVIEKTKASDVKCDQKGKVPCPPPSAQEVDGVFIIQQ